MIDVYAANGTFANNHDLAQQLAAAVMRCSPPRLATRRSPSAPGS
jgi:hypothetical protein